MLGLQTPDGSTPLHFALEFGPTDDDLYLAKRHRSPEMIQCLLQGVDLSVVGKVLGLQNSDGHTPLHLA